MVRTRAQATRKSRGDMPPPPPPPPGPPPPPLMAVGPPPAGGDGRNLLLQSIRQGTKLKKVDTVDKSAPLVTGKVARSPTNAGPGGSPRTAAPASPPALPAPNGLGGLFAGGMPKLKPIGGRSLSTETSPSATPPPPPSDPPRRVFPGDVFNRGPPPQPPPASQKPSGTLATSTSDSVLTDRSQRTAPVPPSKPPVGSYRKPNVAPKPPAMPPPPPSVPPSASPSSSPSASPSSGPPKPSPPPKKVMNGGPRLSVSRAQSMRVPGSPTVTSPQAPVFPAAPSHPDLSRVGMSSFHQSQENLSGGANLPRRGTLPNNMNKPNAPAPPPPRQIRPPAARPPPPPTRPVPPVAPPPPPPTTAPPPPPSRTVHKSNSLNTGDDVSPVVPVRSHSIRNGSSLPGDFESRFTNRFHLVDEFPTPPRYRGVQKIYSSRTSAKQQAPLPPTQTPTHLQLAGAMWPNNTSTC